MAYDLSGAWNSYTGHNSPLYPRSDETGDNATLNVVRKWLFEHVMTPLQLHFSFLVVVKDWAAYYWHDGGCPKEKLVIGMPTYGRCFTLVDASNNGMGAPASGAGPIGEWTGEAGFNSYYEVS